MTNEELGAIRRRADWDPDSIFVDAAREDVPKLLAEIERLQAKLERVEGAVATQGRRATRGNPGHRCDYRVRLDALLQSLREALSGPEGET